MRHAATALLSTITTVALLAGCAEDDTTDASAPAPEPSVTGTSTVAAEPVGVGTARQTGKGSGAGLLVLTDVRVTETDGIDRVVLEFSGRGTPGWGVEYVDRPVLEGSGDVVPLDGESTLQIFASDTTWPAPDYYDGPARLDADGGGPLEEVYVGGTFEGYTQVLAGVAGEAPFRVRTRTGPSRLVVEVLDGDAD